MIMKKFEYKTKINLSERDLNLYGQDRWELVHIQRDFKTGYHWFYLKKEIVV